MTRFLLLLIFAPLLVILIVFTYLNAQSVEINFLVSHYQMPLAVIILGSVLIGTVLGYLINVIALLKCKRENYKLRHPRKALTGRSISKS